MLSVKSHFSVAAMYAEGDYVEKDKKKAKHFMELAAIGGHPTARYNLGSDDIHNGKPERAVKHRIIGAKLGDDVSMKALRIGHEGGTCCNSTCIPGCCG